MKPLLFFSILFFCCSGIVFSQDGFVIQNKFGKEKIHFKLINNLIVFPVEVNGVSLSFIFDTGITKPMIFNILNVSDSLKIKNTQTILLRGLGEGASVEALRSKNNTIRIGDIINLNQDLYAIYDKSLNFAPKLGLAIHGIIGYDILRDFIVEINYTKKYLKFTKPSLYNYKKCNTCQDFSVVFYKNKPLINGKVTINDTSIPVKLLIDSGGSDSLWLFEDDALGITSGVNYFDDFLGHGLSGSVYGKRGRVAGFSLKNFKLHDVNVAYPDSTSINYTKVMQGRNGSVSGDILKRFNLIFNYGKSTIRIKKNRNFKKKFGYNKSGIVLEHGGYRYVREKDNRYNFRENKKGDGNNKVYVNTQYKLVLKPVFVIVELRKGASAEKVGLKLGDIILSVNGNSVNNYSLQQVTQLFYGEEGKLIKLKVGRLKNVLSFKFRLKDVLSK